MAIEIWSSISEKVKIKVDMFNSKTRKNVWLKKSEKFYDTESFKIKNRKIGKSRKFIFVLTVFLCVTPYRGTQSET